MNTQTLVSILIALSLSTGGLALGKSNEHDRTNQQQRDNERGQDRRHSPGPDRRDQEERQPERRKDRMYVNDHDRRDERGAGPRHDFHRGSRLPVEYRHRQYVVDDWRGHHLSPPPRGYHWVQTGGDYVLVAITTGLILQILLGN